MFKILIAHEHQNKTTLQYLLSVHSFLHGWDQICVEAWKISLWTVCLSVWASGVVLICIVNPAANSLLSTEWYCGTFPPAHLEHQLLSINDSIQEWIIYPARTWTSPCPSSKRTQAYSSMSFFRHSVFKQGFVPVLFHVFQSLSVTLTWSFLLFLFPTSPTILMFQCRLCRHCLCRHEKQTLSNLSA